MDIAHDLVVLFSCSFFYVAACLTWELAESGKDFITSLVNRNDAVPSFCKISAARVRSEVIYRKVIQSCSICLHHTPSSIEATRVLKQIYLFL